MAARRGKQDYHITIQSEAQFYSHVNETNKKVTIVDVYTHWCGPCTLMQTNFKNIALRIDDWQEKVEFIVVDVDKVPELQQYQTSSRPKFLMYRKGQLLAEINGLDIPQIKEVLSNRNLFS